MVVYGLYLDLSNILLLLLYANRDKIHFYLIYSSTQTPLHISHNGNKKIIINFIKAEFVRAVIFEKQYIVVYLIKKPRCWFHFKST